MYAFYYMGNGHAPARPRARATKVTCALCHPDRLHPLNLANMDRGICADLRKDPPLVPPPPLGKPFA